MVDHNTDEHTSRLLGSSSKLLCRAWASSLTSFRLVTTLFAWEDWAFTVEAAREATRATELMNFIVLVLLCKMQDGKRGFGRA